MAKGSKKSLGLDTMFPLGSTTTDTALSQAFQGFPEEATLKAAVGDIGRTYGNISIEKIVPNPFQPRKNFDQQKLQELADSLSEEGMLEPILVRVSPTQPGMYEIAAGERRWRAAILAEWMHCPAEIMTSCPDARMKRIALLENLQREELSPMELALTYEALLHDRDDGGKPAYTVRSLAEMLKKDKSHVDDHLALLRVPEDTRQLIEEDPDIPLRVIRELGTVEDPADRAYLIDEVRARNLKTADIVAILQQRKKRQQKSTASRITGPAPAQTASHEDRSPSSPVPAQIEEPPETTTVIMHERRVAPPSPALAFALLERKLQKDEAQLAKMVDRLLGELPTMNAEERALVGQYIARCREKIQQIADYL
jgi:ParB family chromosome partitioning protein